MKITKELLKQIIREEIGQRGRDNPVLFKVNQMASYVNKLAQSARTGDAELRKIAIQEIRSILKEIEMMQ